MRVCVVYDCLFPWTVGGAERWYRALAERLAREGHEVCYLTLRQWDRGAPPDLPGVRVVAVGPRMALYTASGRRRILPPLLFGLGVLGHLAARGRRYDVVHTASFPYFSLLAAAVARPAGRYRIVVDWVEFWTREYWTDYLGPAGGRVGWAVQSLCARVRQHAFCFAETTARRLAASGLRGEVEVLRGLHTGRFAGDTTVREPAPSRRPPTAVFAGRHIPEKQVPALPAALAVARRELPDLRLDVFGDGPERAAVETAAEPLGDAVRILGFAAEDDVEAALASAACMVLPSRREGYGMVVVEAAARGCPSVVVDHPDNAATELVEDGVNGVRAATASPEDLGRAIARAVRGGDALRASTARWYAEHARDLALETSLGRVVAAYGRS